MKHDLFINRMIFVASLMLVPLIMPVGALATEQEEENRDFSEAQGHMLEQIAVESVQDTLKACLGRIPLDASVGQLLLAQQNCQQAEGNRTNTSLTF